MWSIPPHSSGELLGSTPWTYSNIICHRFYFHSIIFHIRSSDFFWWFLIYSICHKTFFSCFFSNTKWFYVTFLPRRPATCSWARVNLDKTWPSAKICTRTSNLEIKRSQKSNPNRIRLLKRFVLSDCSKMTVKCNNHIKCRLLSRMPAPWDRMLSFLDFIRNTRQSKKEISPSSTCLKKTLFLFCSFEPVGHCGPMARTVKLFFSEAGHVEGCQRPFGFDAEAPTRSYSRQKIVVGGDESKSEPNQTSGIVANSPTWYSISWFFPWGDGGSVETVLGYLLMPQVMARACHPTSSCLELELLATL